MMKSALIYILPLFACIALGAPALADARYDNDGADRVEDGAPGERSESPAPPVWERREYSPPLSRLFYGLAVVIVILCVGLYLFKLLNGNNALNRGRYFDVLEVKHLGQKSFIYLVQVGDKVIMLASRGESIRREGVFRRDELPESDAPDEDKNAFSFAFRKALGRSR